ncbi:hypothetical protein P171DRAFT_48124 [Karstenula rhodostoma CBS 690.94]|uniref:Uncharacterized protein n=1 Tax=Karstenula rhodostoma CBS 690.94 TaxID=1392251 RepID=A0A9P4PGT5_9PLEO|nr:hypothetical protein P171DRAFT_48124 [Karstenula rhodostoma CBS 690.94]
MLQPASYRLRIQTIYTKTHPRSYTGTLLSSGEEAVCRLPLGATAPRASSGLHCLQRKAKHAVRCAMCGCTGSVEQPGGRSTSHSLDGQQTAWVSSSQAGVGGVWAMATDAVLNVQARRDESTALPRRWIGLGFAASCKPQASSATQLASTRPAWHRVSSSTPQPGCLLKRHQPGTASVGRTHWPCLAHPDTRHRSAVHLHPSWKPKPSSLSDPRADQEPSLCASQAVGCTLGWGRRAGLGCIPGHRHHYRRPCTR